MTCFIISKRIMKRALTSYCNSEPPKVYMYSSRQRANETFFKLGYFLMIKQLKLDKYIAKWKLVKLLQIDYADGSIMKDEIKWIRIEMEMSSVYHKVINVYRDNLLLLHLSLDYKSSYHENRKSNTGMESWSSAVWIMSVFWMNNCTNQGRQATQSAKRYGRNN